MTGSLVKRCWCFGGKTARVKSAPSRCGGVVRGFGFVGVVSLFFDLKKLLLTVAAFVVTFIAFARLP